MSIIDDFVGGFKEIYSSRDRRVRIPLFLYEELLDEAGNEEDIENLLASILAERFELRTEQKVEQQKEEEHQVILKESYIDLDRYLYSNINRNVKIGITNELIGREPSNCNYILRDYKLSMVDKYLRLELERNGEVYPISFRSILDIKFNNNAEFLNTWVYIPEPLGTWRFYLNYDPSKTNASVNSGKLYL